MRCVAVVCCASLLIVLASNPVAVADPSWAKVSAELTGTGYTNVTNLAVTGSKSQAYVRDSLGNLDSYSDWTPTTDTASSAAISSATGSAQTTYPTYFHLYADSVATPPTGVKSFSGLEDVDHWNTAYQEWTFQAASAGTVTFNFDSHVVVDLQTALAGEKASGNYEVWLGLSSSSGGWTAAWIGGVGTEVQDGSDYSHDWPGPLSVELAFAAGESGTLYMQVRTYGSANTVVPLPPAILLGVLGLGAAGVKLRKYA